LREISRASSLPVITKPALGRRLGGEIARLLELEAAATDLYSLGYPDPARREGGAEWKLSPSIERRAAAHYI
jgi:hypothetical protein